jgi:phospholipid/cholesterol/gamma-HCH transport system permease protein
MVSAQLVFVGRSCIAVLEGFGQFTLFCAATWRWLWLGWRQWARWHVLMPQLYQIGTRSISVVMLVGAFIGMVLAIETYAQFAELGLAERLGGLIAISVVKQIGPVMAAVMLAGRVGGSVSAELGTMRVTEQLDAMRVMGADPIAHLVVPRVVACVLMIPVLTVLSNLTGVFGGYLITVRGFGVNEDAYWEFSKFFVANFDIFTGLIKSVVFGLVIGLVSCYKGYYCAPGAAGVGRAATSAFVFSFIGIIVTNLFLAKFLSDVYSMIYGATLVSPFGG